MKIACSSKVKDLILQAQYERLETNATRERAEASVIFSGVTPNQVDEIRRVFSKCQPEGFELFVSSTLISAASILEANYANKAAAEDNSKDISNDLALGATKTTMVLDLEGLETLFASWEAEINFKPSRLAKPVASETSRSKAAAAITA